MELLEISPFPKIPTALNNRTKIFSHSNIAGAYQQATDSWREEPNRKYMRSVKPQTKVKRRKTTDDDSEKENYIYDKNVCYECSIWRSHSGRYPVGYKAV
jgi:hypothetical protein